MAVAIACFTACALCLTSNLLASTDYGYFLANEEDEYARLTCELLRIQQLPVPLEGVALVGSSSIREAISDANGIALILQNEVSRPIDAVCLNVAGLRLWEKAQVCYCLENHLKGAVVIQIDPLDLSLDRESHSSFVKNPRLAAGFEAFDEELREAGMPVPRRMGNYFLDNYGFFVARPGIVLNLFTGPKEVTTHLAETWRPISPEETRAAVERHKENWSSYERNRKKSYETYRRIVARLQSKGIEVVLLEGIRNRAYDDEVFDTPEMRSLLTLYGEEVRQFASDLGITYLDLYDEAGLSGADFTDTTHVRSGLARERFTRALSGHLAKLVESALEAPSAAPRTQNGLETVHAR
ncbi:MAG: hypothetical protein GY851_34220 [bacterium]|nr:hypothetical protein [bacterium]